MTGPRLRNSVVKLLSALLFILALSVAPAKAIVRGYDSPLIGGQVQILEDGDFICTGSLIGAGWVLTAHHCFLDNAPGPHTYGILYGNFHFGQETYDEIGQIVTNPDADAALARLNNLISDPNMIARAGVLSRGQCIGRSSFLKQLPRSAGVG